MYIINNKHIFIAASTAIGPDAVGYNVDVLCSGDFRFFDASLNLKKKFVDPEHVLKWLAKNVEIECRNNL